MKTNNPNSILVLLLIGFIAVAGVASSEDYNIAVIESMPEEVYDSITAKLGPGCSNRQIVKEYERNREQYALMLDVWEE